jgi:CIC family chloride channel protein
MTHEFSVVPALMLGALVSQAIGRKLCRESFYEAVLTQDGHKLEHVIPPRDLRSWQQLPISAIANFQPVVLRGLEAESMRAALNGHPYNYFPVVLDGTLSGILSRQKAEAAMAAGQPPVLQKAVTCLPTESVRKLQFLLIESPTGVAVLLDRPDGQVLGVVTLHDLLRAQVSMAAENE